MYLPETEKLFYLDSYERQFTARVLSVADKGDCCDVVLDRTLLYPEGGGQPCDTGEINGIAVINVHEENGVIIHTVNGRLTQGEAVHGNVSWERRFDHMQQHTGQHILSRAFLKIYGAKTVGFHLGKNFVTIDIDMDIHDREKLVQVEQLANIAVYENRRVKTKVVGRDEAKSLQLRKPPPDEDNIRIVEVEGFEMTACCGTHVSSTGEIGIIKIVKSERHRNGSRVSFVCGNRAFIYFTHIANIVQDISNHLNTGYNELISKVINLEQENKSLKRSIKHAEGKILDIMINEISSEEYLKRCDNVIEVFDENLSAGSIRMLVQKLIKLPNVIVIIGTNDDFAHVVMGSSEDVNIDLKKIFNRLLLKINGKGGGAKLLMQGSGDVKSNLHRAIHEAAELARESLKSNSK